LDWELLDGLEVVVLLLLTGAAAAMAFVVVAGTGQGGVVVCRGRGQAKRGDMGGCCQRPPLTLEGGAWDGQTDGKTAYRTDGRVPCGEPGRVQDRW
jgi:hypothetical protein